LRALALDYVGSMPVFVPPIALAILAAVFRCYIFRALDD